MAWRLRKCAERTVSGIPDGRLKISAMGLADPLSPDQTPLEKARNRVVEVAEAPEFPSESD